MSQATVTPTTATKPPAKPPKPVNHAINWFEIPVADMDRSVAFYEKLLDVKLHREVCPNTKLELALFPGDANDGVRGALMGTGKVTPADNGVLLYLNAGASLDAALGRLDAAGGKLLLPPVVLPEGLGRFAHIADPDGQRIGLHALN